MTKRLGGPDGRYQLSRRFSHWTLISALTREVDPIRAEVKFACAQRWDVFRVLPHQFAPLGKAIGIPFLVLGVVLFVAGIGNIGVGDGNVAVAIIAIQVAGHLVSMIMRGLLDGRQEPPL